MSEWRCKCLTKEAWDDACKKLDPNRTWVWGCHMDEEGKCVTRDVWFKTFDPGEHFYVKQEGAKWVKVKKES